MAQKIELIRQALSAAESSLKLARQLLSDIERSDGGNRQKTTDLPGVAGVFDGQNMITEKGESFPVPENYASKSILVVGDTLKLVQQGKEKRFKQIEHVKRHKTSGILTKKDGKWAAVTSEGSYKLLSASVDHYNGEVGDEILVQIPANNLQSTWAAVENVVKKKESKPLVKEDKQVEEKKKEDKPTKTVSGEGSKAKTESKIEAKEAKEEKEEKEVKEKEPTKSTLGETEVTEKEVKEKEAVKDSIGEADITVKEEVKAKDAAPQTEEEEELA